ncbi:thioredoxin family protein [Asinibacterium sp. OR53]|uniref:TlpA family protein disulfide reductase n=1 Tax=Asinibacterium sp. OR53 TaxID=925409 RepID=UPI00047A7A28|nr:thioredoxin family protein [Asinibacterium sp. OR53]
MRITKYIIRVVVFITLVYLGYTLYKSEDLKKSDISKIASLESLIKSIRIDYIKPIDTSILKEKKSVLLIFFSADCEHCQNMLQKIITHKSFFAKSYVIMISIFDQRDIIEQLVKKNDLNSSNYISVGIIDRSTSSFLKISTTPTFLIYKENALTKKIVGETSLGNLLTE